MTNHTGTPAYADSTITLHHGDCLAVLRELPDASVDSVVTDPPYGLEFMGKGWDAPWRESDVNADAGFHGGGIRQTGNLPSFTGSTNPKCLRCKGTRRGRRDGTAKVAVCLCEDGGRFPNVRAVEMRAFQTWCEEWATECLRVLKPGGHLLAFGGTRTYHRLACAVEDAGFEIRDSLAWLYGSGFPKSLDVSKAIDKAAGAEREVVGDKLDRPGYHLSGHDSGTGALGRGISSTTPDTRLASALITAPATPEAEQWQGWGTALKPAFEPIVMGRKPLAGTVAANVLAHGTGALNVDACRVGESGGGTQCSHRDTAGDCLGHPDSMGSVGGGLMRHGANGSGGRWPANVVLDESQAAVLDEQSGTLTSGKMAAGTPRSTRQGAALGKMPPETEHDTPGDSGGASRFFYVAKADQSERVRVNGVAHPTVKPLSVMRWLVRMITPPGGLVLDPFAGSGTTGEAALLEGLLCILIEREAEYLPLIKQRIHRRLDPVEAVRGAGGDGGLFDLLDEGGAA